jgi:hypothetical protein
VALEYTMASLITAGFLSMLWLFYQGFVQGNLYGSTGDRHWNQDIFRLHEDDKAMGLEKAVSLPFP